MKTSFYIRIGTAIIFLLNSYACTKKIALKELQFDAAVSKTTYTTNDTIAFTLTGNPDLITFYADVPGNRFAYRNRTKADGKPILQFTSARANGSQANSLALMVSSDFAGVAGTDTITSLANITKASWTDITSRAMLSTGSAVSSGSIDLSDFVAKPVYVAFKYTAVSGSIQNKWTITALSVNNVLSDGTSYLIGNLNANNTAITNYGVSTYSPGWVSYKVKNSYAWSVAAGTSLTISGATTAATATSDAEAWVLMGPIDLKKVTPDMGVPIKAIIDNMNKFPYSYQYKTAGNYQAIFIGMNQNRDNVDSVIRILPITVK